MRGVGGMVDGGSDLANIEQRDPFLGRCLRRAFDGINTLAKNVAASGTGENAPPPPPASVSVSSGGEMMHVTINHPGVISRNIRYFVEVATEPTFAAPAIVKDAGSSRTPEPFHLPTNDGAGNKYTYYVRSYAQNGSSQPSAPVPAQGSFQMAGTTNMDFAAPRGSGTGPNSGLGGQGLGKVQQRGS